MKNNGLQFLIGSALAAILFGACMEPFDSSKNPLGQDDRGRRLVTITVNLEKAARSVNTPLARAYIDFYEVVFVGPGAVTEYYSAIATKGAGRRLSLRVPAGDYTAYLNAGYLEPGGEAVLLAQDSVTTAQAASAPWSFSLKALNLQVNGPKSPATTTTPGISDGSDPVYVQINNAAAPIRMTSGGIPFYAPAPGDPVAVIVTTGVKNMVDYGAGNVAVTPLSRKSDTPPVIVDITPSPAFTASTGILTFGFTAPTAGNGLSNVGFDVTVAAVAAARSNGLEPVYWHIRNGLNVDVYDNGLNDATNTGAGLVFAFGTALPSASDTYGISFAPPVIP
ncbi:MAG: hypothetical protein LBG14_00245 [Treponema sp.]|jgi:hypothetical protein|nr:hypothetical protein [Treponema sp.]